jgi:hypothetical protein
MKNEENKVEKELDQKKIENSTKLSTDKSPMKEKK